MNEKFIKAVNDLADSALHDSRSEVVIAKVLNVINDESCPVGLKEGLLSEIYGTEGFFSKLFGKKRPKVNESTLQKTWNKDTGLKIFGFCVGYMSNIQAA